MDNTTREFVLSNQIDSFHKLRLLLLLYANPDLSGSSDTFARRLYLGDESLLERIILELQNVGLLIRTGSSWQLPNEPDLKEHLGELAQAYDNPITRQSLLQQVTAVYA